jgi:hypothetical protein
MSVPNLSVALEVPENITVGLSVLATLRVKNSGASPVTISARLNLMEGDVRLILTGSSGAPRVIQGWQADTMLRQVTLQPGEQLVGSMNLLQTESGPIFTAPGRYRLEAQYTPSAREEPIGSTPVVLTVRQPKTDAERGAAEVLEDETVRRALVLAEPDSAPEKLEQLVTKFPKLLDGQLARLILASDKSADAPQAADPLSQALMIAALSTPFSRVGLSLAESFASQLEAQDAAGKVKAAKQATIKRALRIARGQPIESD